MGSGQEQLTFVGDRTILLVSSLGLLCVGVAVLWIARRSPGWALYEDVDGPPRPWWNRLLWATAGDRHHNGENDDIGDGAIGGRTRVVRGGREATKAARKEAKKKAKAEFRRSQDASTAQESRQRLQNERRKAAEMNRGEQTGSRSIADLSVAREAIEHSAELLRKLENYIMGHKVSSLKDMGVKFAVPTTEVEARIKELVKMGRIVGVTVDSSAQGEREGASSSFVRVSLDEIRTLAAFVNGKGRVSVAELTREANKVLQLSPSQNEFGREMDVSRRETEHTEEAGADEYNSTIDTNRVLTAIN